MAVDLKIILGEIDVALNEYDGFLVHIEKVDEEEGLSPQGLAETQMIRTRLANTIHRLSPPTSNYRHDLNRLSTNIGTVQGLYSSLPLLHRTLKALRKEYELGYLKTVEELIHADTFSNMLDMASSLLRQGYKDAAAVIAGSVLEQHLRDLAQRSGTIAVLGADGKPRKADSLNNDLKASGAYNILEQKSVTAWLDLRNKAARGNYSEYDARHVLALIDGIRDFMVRHPA